MKDRRLLLRKYLVEIWTEVLKVERVGRKDNFFALGGHSLLATQTMSRVRDVLHVEAPLRWLFENSVLSEFAVRLQGLVNLVNNDRELAVPPLVRRERSGRLPLSFAQQRLWFLDQLEPGSKAYNVSPALRMKGNLDVWAMGKSFTEIVRRHEVLRTAFVAEAGEAMQQIGPARPIALPVIDVSYLDEHERELTVQRLIQREVNIPFNLGREPLLRLLLLRLHELDHVLLISLHHIVTDGWYNRNISARIHSALQSFL